MDFRLTAFTLITVCVLAGGAVAQNQDSMACEKKVEKVRIPEVTTYKGWNGAAAGKLIAGRIPAGTPIKFCAPNQRLAVAVDGGLVWIDSFAVQIEGADRALAPQPEDHDKTAGQRAEAAEPATERPARVASSGRFAEREEIAEMSLSKPNIDLEIQFDYNSALLPPAEFPALQALGKAMSDDSLKGSVFLIRGHAGERGSAARNLELSERRAEAVRQYLIDHFGLAPSSLITTGLGKTKMKNPANPSSAENRRVQITNKMN